jgi:hypothetical protein
MNHCAMPKGYSFGWFQDYYALCENYQKKKSKKLRTDSLNMKMAAKSRGKINEICQEISNYSKDLGISSSKPIFKISLMHQLKGGK